MDLVVGDGVAAVDEFAEMSREERYDYCFG